jgi:hypothetical protein
MSREIYRGKFRGNGCRTSEYREMNLADIVTFRGKNLGGTLADSLVQASWMKTPGSGSPSRGSPAAGSQFTDVRRRDKREFSMVYRTWKVGGANDSKQKLVRYRGRRVHLKSSSPWRSLSAIADVVVFVVEALRE